MEIIAYILMTAVDNLRHIVVTLASILALAIIVGAAI